MHVRRVLLSATVALTLTIPTLAPAHGDTSGISEGPRHERNVSATPDLASSKAKIDGFGFYVPARSAAGDAVEVEYRDASGDVVETRDEARPLISVYTDDDSDPAKGDDVWAAYSLDDGDTWQLTNLSMAAGRSSFTVDEGEESQRDYPGMVSKPALTMKANKVLVSWTSSFCDDGFPAYEGSEEDPYGVSVPQRSVDYTDQGYPEVGEVPFKCLWATRGLVDKTTGAITWYQPERLTSGARYAMQVASSSAPNAGFVVAWAEDPDGLDPGQARGPGEGWTGANPHPGTDVWYSYLPMSSFDASSSASDPDDPEQIALRPRPVRRFEIPVPVSDNAQLDPSDPPAAVGATRPALGVSPYTFTKADGSTGRSAWVAYGYEETKEGDLADDDVETGKQVFHHAFRFDDPDVFASGDLVSDPAQSGRRVRYITQPMAELGDSRTLGALLYRMGGEQHAGAADFIVHRFVVPGTEGAGDNPFRLANLTGPVNVSATSEETRVADPTTGVPRVARWTQTEANLDDSTFASGLESARGHRGMIKGDFLALGYLWTPNWDLYLQGLDIENYYVRRSFDGGASFTSAPAEAPYDGDGVTSCRWFNDPVTGDLLAPECHKVAAGAFEPAQNLTRLDGFDETAIEPRLFGLPGSIPASEGSGTEPGVPYPEDVQDVSVLWQAWGTGAPQEAAAGDDGGDFSAQDADIPLPGEDDGKGPLDLFFTFSQDYGDTYVENDVIADGPSAQAEVQLRFSPDGSKMYAAWNDLGTLAGVDEQLDVFFRRLMPDAFPHNTTPGELSLSAATYAVDEGDDLEVVVNRVTGHRGAAAVTVSTEDGTAKAGDHYEAFTKELAWDHGDRAAKSVTVHTVEDDVDNADRELRVVLTAAEGALLGRHVLARVRIRDDDDAVAPRSKASSPTLTNRVKIPVSYEATDDESGVAGVELFVKKPGTTKFVLAATETTFDGRMSYATNGRNGRYSFYTVAQDEKGNREPVPTTPDTVTTLDTVAPTVLTPSVRPRPFDIGRDGVLKMRGTVAEPATTQFLVKRHGRVVRALRPSSSEAGVVRRRWNGRRDDGALVRAGRFVVVLKATDEAGNVARRHVGLRLRR